MDGQYIYQGESDPTCIEVIQFEGVLLAAGCLSPHAKQEGSKYGAESERHSNTHYTGESMRLVFNSTVQQESGVDCGTKRFHFYAGVGVPAICQDK